MKASVGIFISWGSFSRIFKLAHIYFVTIYFPVCSIVMQPLYGVFNITDVSMVAIKGE